MATNPTLLKMPLGRDGDKATIPVTDDGTTGDFSQQYGFQLINSLPLTAGGKAVLRQDLNGVFNLLSNILFYAQKGWQWQWDSGQDYYKGCIVIDTYDNKRYKCKADVTANNAAPHSDTTHWEEDAETFPYLPITGGTLEGPEVKRNVDNEKLVLLGSTADDHGAGLFLYGRYFAGRPGGFVLRASNGTYTKDLIGGYDGTLTWDGEPLLTRLNMPTSMPNYGAGVDIANTDVVKTMPFDGLLVVDAYAGSGTEAARAKITVLDNADNTLCDVQNRSIQNGDMSKYASTSLLIPKNQRFSARYWGNSGTIKAFPIGQ